MWGDTGRTAVSPLSSRTSRMDTAVSYTHLALRRCEISDVLMREMRSSAIFLGAILARCGQADLSYPCLLYTSRCV